MDRGAPVDRRVPLPESPAAARTPSGPEMTISGGSAGGGPVWRQDTLSLGRRSVPPCQPCGRVSPGVIGAGSPGPRRGCGSSLVPGRGLGAVTSGPRRPARWVRPGLPGQGVLRAVRVDRCSEPSGSGWGRLGSPPEPAAADPSDVGTGGGASGVGAGSSGRGCRRWGVRGGSGVGVGTGGDPAPGRARGPAREPGPAPGSVPGSGVGDGPGVGRDRAWGRGPADPAAPRGGHRPGRRRRRTSHRSGRR